jgi:hypothetical protein
MALVLIQTQQQQIIVITILISSNQNYELESDGSTTLVKKFTVVVNPGAVSGTMLSGLLDGINYNTADATKATGTGYAVKVLYVREVLITGNSQCLFDEKDPTSGKFWTGLGLTSEVTTYRWEV